MTDRHSGYIIALDRDIPEDDAEHIINAIRMIKGVMAVEEIPAMHSAAYVAERRRDKLWRDHLHKLLRDGPEETP